MTSKIETIKQENQKVLMGYTGGNAVLLAWLIVGFPIDGEAMRMLTKVDYTKAGGSLLLTAVVVLLSNLASARVKETLVFWKWRDPLPSTRFVSLMASDPRIDSTRISAVFKGKLPAAPREQGSEWYKLYKRHKDDASVHAVNKEYLMLRDLAWLTLVLILFSRIGAFVTDAPMMPMLVHTLALFALWALFCIGAHNNGERLVLTVLACESASPAAPKSK